VKHQLDPVKAKLAAQIIRDQEQRLETLEAENQELTEKTAKFERERECLTIAHKLAEIGRIPNDFGSILEKAASIADSDKDIEVIKEAIDMSQNNFDLGQLGEDGPSDGNEDAITNYLLSLT
jgi:hypothetical protein